MKSTGVTGRVARTSRTRQCKSAPNLVLLSKIKAQAQAKAAAAKLNAKMLQLDEQLYGPSEGKATQYYYQLFRDNVKDLATEHTKAQASEALTDLMKRCYDAERGSMMIVNTLQLAQHIEKAHETYDCKLLNGAVSKCVADLKANAYKFLKSLG